MSKLFKEFKINNLTLKNRFIMSAAADNLDNDHSAQINRFLKLSKGQIGLIISGGVRLNKIENWTDIIDIVHKNHGKFAIQFVAGHGPGIISKSKDINEDKIAISVLPEDHIYFKSLAPFICFGKHHEASEDELKGLINTYTKAAANVKKIGADAIQIHAAHQSFLSQSLSPLTNTRTDKWGGSILNRTRLHRFIYKAVRDVVGKDFPILIKLGIQDAVNGGLQIDEGVEAAKLIADCGYDAIEISQGLQDYSSWEGTPMRVNIKNIEDEAYFRYWCKQVKNSISKPTILTGGIRSPELMNQLIDDDITDCIGMCRSFVREPALIRRWQDGNLEKAKCISCNKCLTELFLNGEPLECFLDKK